MKPLKSSNLKPKPSRKAKAKGPTPVDNSKRELAESPGVVDPGVPGPREDAKKAEPEKPSFEVDPNSDWCDTATVENQHTVKGAWKHDRREILVFDLAKPEDLTKMNELLSKTMSAFTNTFIMDQQRQFCQSTENWKVIMTVLTLKYKRIIKNTERKQNV